MYSVCLGDYSVCLDMFPFALMMFPFALMMFPFAVELLSFANMHLHSRLSMYVINAISFPFTISSEHAHQCDYRVTYALYRKDRANPLSSRNIKNALDIAKRQYKDLLFGN